MAGYRVGSNAINTVQQRQPLQSYRVLLQTQLILIISSRENSAPRRIVSAVTTTLMSRRVCSFTRAEMYRARVSLIPRYRRLTGLLRLQCVLP